MLTLDLPAHIEQVIINQAKNQGISVADLIAEKFRQPEMPENPMIAAVMALEPSSHFQNADAVALQREWRDEWES